jgi:hypothetical protein
MLTHDYSPLRQGSGRISLIFDVERLRAEPLFFRAGRTAHLQGKDLLAAS